MVFCVSAPWKPTAGIIMVVDRTLREHITNLEARIKLLSEQMMEAHEITARNRMEAEIRAANIALTHYKAALQVEESLGLTA
jgi:hypothetical protein